MSDMDEPKTDERYEPRITAFVCNWCTYTGADLAGTSRLQMAANVRIIRLPCTGRIDPMFIIKAFERGADGVIVSGCHPADCHYNSGNYHARRRFAVFSELSTFLGIDPGRVTYSWVSASEGAKWRDVVEQTVARVRALGPFTAYRELIGRPSASGESYASLDDLVGAALGGCPPDDETANAAATKVEATKVKVTTAEATKVAAGSSERSEP